MHQGLSPLVVTSGEPAGIGPELCAMLAQSDLASRLQRPIVILGDAQLLQARARHIGLEPSWAAVTDMGAAQTPGCYTLHTPLAQACFPGQPDCANALYVLSLLDQACDACLNGQAAAMVTAPIQKSTISPMWPGFQGHTEYLAQRCGQSDVVMMLVGGGLKVALATTHLPLAQVPQALTQHSLESTLLILLQGLSRHWALEKPRVLVAGLNPHAGENGTLGLEDQEVIAPAIEHLRQAGHAVSGPYPADTLFQPKYLDQADAVLAMYHDQGLPVLKFASFGQGVNITLGLPITRTSVDHGTALDLAGTRNMNLGSLTQAVECAHHMDKNQHA